jgi:hypothetical protein
MEVDLTPEQIEWCCMTEEREMTSDPNEWQVMAQKMLDETLVTEDLDTIRESLFKQQMEESMTYIPGVMKWWSNLEKEWRTISGGRPVPTKYRTNKSVILKACRHEADRRKWMVDGEMMGKTAVQTRCQESTPVMRSPEAMCKIIVNMITQYERQQDKVQADALITLMYEWTKDRAA